MSAYDRNAFVREIGDGRTCARKGCAKGPRWRIGHGHWNMQSWVCRTHVPWALELEQLTQARGEALGWEYGHVKLSADGKTVVSSEIRTPWITPTMGQITPYGQHGGRSLVYDRDVSAEVNNGTARNEG